MKAKQLQENNVDIVPVTHEDIVFDNNGTNIPNKYQTKEDNTLNTTDKTIVGAINELFQNVSSGKELIATAITDKGVTTSSDDTFQTMADNIASIENGSTLPKWLVTGDSYLYARAMPTPRKDFSASTLNNKIYVFGGRDNDGNVLATSERYDTITNTWVAISDLLYQHFGTTASTVGNYIYIIGGNNGTYSSIKTDRYDSLTDTHTYMTDSIIYPYFSSEGVVGDKIYIMGLSNGGVASNTCSCYDTSIDTWSNITGMPTAGYSATASVVDDKVYVIGGYYQRLANECYDSLTDTWTTKSPLPANRYLFSSSVLDRKIYCFNGYGSSVGNTCICYDVDNDTWETKSNLNISRHGSIAETANGNIYIIGGVNGSSIKTENECYIK